MEEVFDLAVVGAGPAGLMTAKIAAEQGLKVAVIERKQDIAQIRRACCAQFAMDDGYANETIQVRDGKVIFLQNRFEVRYDGPTIDVINKYYFSPKGHRIHFAHPDRSPFAIKFDKERLLNQLLEDIDIEGVHFLTRTVAFSAKDAADGVAVQVTADGKHSSVKARKAVIAEGVNAHITGSLGLNAGRNLFAAARTLKIAVEGTRGFEPQSWNLHYGRAYQSNAPVIVGPSLYGDDVVEVTLMAIGEIGPNEVFEGVKTQSPLADRFTNSKVIDKQGCSVRAFPSLKVPYKGNVLVVGDAAAYVEVETQGALMCGFHAGNAVAKELEGENGFEEYTNWWKASFEFNTDDYLKVAQGYALVPTYSDDELDYLFALTEDEILEGTYSQYKTPELIWKSVLRDPKRIAAEMPQLYEKIKKNSQMTLSTLSAES